MHDDHVVFLAHAADRTGPPIYLLQLLRALDGPSQRFTVVFLRGGELLSEFRQVAEVRVIGEPVDPKVASPTRLADEPARLRARRAQLADLHDIDLLVVNTAWSVHALPWLPAGSHPTVSIVHELQAGVGELLRPQPLATLLASDRFVSGCHAVARMLEEDHGISPDLIDVIAYGVDIGHDSACSSDRSRRHADSNQVVVVAAAVPDRRKGPDLFVHLAAIARRRRPDIDWAFRWIGSEVDDPKLREVVIDQKLLKAEELVKFIAPTPHLRSLLCAADLFVLPSREDAFPLAAVEAALAGLPILCFDTTGLSTLVGHDGGATVAFPDLEGMASELITWADDPAAATNAGARARERALRNHNVTDHASAFNELVLQARCRK